MAGLSDGGMTRTFEQNRNARLVPSANEAQIRKVYAGRATVERASFPQGAKGPERCRRNIRFDMSIAQSRQSAPGQRLVKQRLGA
jgi:hypothetical protein